MSDSVTRRSLRPCTTLYASTISSRVVMMGAHGAVAVDLGLDRVAVGLLGPQRRHERVEAAVGGLHLALDADPRLVGGVGGGPPRSS